MILTKIPLLLAVSVLMINCGNTQTNSSNGVDTTENKSIISDSSDFITRNNSEKYDVTLQKKSDTDKLIYFFNKTKDEIRDYEGDEFSFIAFIGSYYGNTAGFAIEKGESLDGLVVYVPLLYKNKDNEVELYYGKNTDVISRIRVNLTKNQYDKFNTSEVSILNLKKVKEDIGKEQKTHIFTNEKFVFVINSQVFHGEFSGSLSIYSIKELDFALNTSNGVSIPN